MAALAERIPEEPPPVEASRAEPSAPVLRDYQARAVRRVEEEWAAGRRAVCLVAPTGSGKTVTAAALTRSAARVVWVAHRRELVTQAATALGRLGLDVGCICPGLPRRLGAAVQVGTVQSLVRRDAPAAVDLVVLDEAHHYAPSAAAWHAFAARYAQARVLGLTATPQRADGSPLGDLFSSLVETASYSELILAGHLVPCHVYAREPGAPASGWAQDPVVAYQTHGEGQPALVYLDRVARCEEWRARFEASGIRAAAVSDATPVEERGDALGSFGRPDGPAVLLSVQVLTEGIDVPQAAVCILGRHPQHASTYLQIVGRIIRPAPGKTHATLLDLVDATHTHGYPTDDRAYSLDQDGIRTVARAALRTCPQCGAVFTPAPACPRCAFVFPVAPPPRIRIWSAALERVYAGAETAEPAKRAELDRLERLARARGFSLGWVAREYRKLFGVGPDLRHVGEPERRRELARLVAFAAERGYKPGFALVRYRDLFGGWPPRAWGRG